MPIDSSLSTHGLSTPKIMQCVLRMVLRYLTARAGQERLQHLDVGAGNGELIDALSRELPLDSRACDYTTELMQIAGQRVDICDLNHDDLPFADNSFDLVTFTEVIEHIDNHRHALREIRRVLKPGGYLILSTPNIHNIKSRLRNLFFGFPVLFSPLHVRESRMYSTAGHINPIGYFYIIHSALDAGLEIAGEDIDKIQRSGLLPFLILYLPILLFGWMTRLREEKKYRTIDDLNRPFVRKINSWKLLLGRTIVIAARKPLN